MKTTLESLVKSYMKSEYRSNSNLEKKIDKSVDNWIKVRTQEKRAEKALALKNKIDETLDRKFTNNVRKFN